MWEVTIHWQVSADTIQGFERWLFKTNNSRMKVARCWVSDVVVDSMFGLRKRGRGGLLVSGLKYLKVSAVSMQLAHHEAE